MEEAILDGMFIRTRGKKAMRHTDDNGRPIPLSAYSPPFEILLKTNFKTAKKASRSRKGGSRKRVCSLWSWKKVETVLDELNGGIQSEITTGGCAVPSDCPSVCPPVCLPQWLPFSGGRKSKKGPKPSLIESRWWYSLNVVEFNTYLTFHAKKILTF